MSATTATLPPYTAPNHGRSPKHIISRVLLYLAVALVLRLWQAKHTAGRAAHA